MKTAQEIEQVDVNEKMDEQANEKVGDYTLAQAIRDGAKLVERQSVGAWIEEDEKGACALGAAYLALQFGKE